MLKMILFLLCINVVFSQVHKTENFRHCINDGLVHFFPAVDEDENNSSNLLHYYTLNGIGYNWFAPSGEKLQDSAVFSISTVHGFSRTDINASGGIGLTYWFTPLENFITLFFRGQRGYIFLEMGKSLGTQINGFTLFYGITVPFEIYERHVIVIDIAYGGIVGPMLISKISYRI
ncbi:MAG: hypothetical protein HYV28_09785 [Ignavibacteriales bacterium]|nr:hypothetical protein [Ignavibacteriales bacterium]